MKEQLLALTNAQAAELSSLQRALKSVSTAQVRQRPLLASVAATARQWFNVVKPSIDKSGFSVEVIAELSVRFEDLLRMSGGSPAKTTLLRAINDLVPLYKTQLVHQIEIGSFTTVSGLNVGPYIEGLPVAEGDFLDEAQRCLSVEALRACIVLGWCATIARIHTKIAEVGFDKFSAATEEMHSKTVGRFKPYNKKIRVESMSELQRVFDTELLWVLEYLELIDSNQHSRLRHCFDMRNHSAHPGQAPITGENLYSFFSDITQIVLKNPKFAIMTKP